MGQRAPQVTFSTRNYKQKVQTKVGPNRSDEQSVQKDTGFKHKVQTRPGRCMRTHARAHKNQKAGTMHSTVRNEVAMTVLMYNLQKQAQDPNRKYGQSRALQSVQKDARSGPPPARLSPSWRTYCPHPRFHTKVRDRAHAHTEGRNDALRSEKRNCNDHSDVQSAETGPGS